MFKTNAKSCPICSGASTISRSHRCQDYYDTINQGATITCSTTVPDKKPIEISVPLSLLVEMYGISVTIGREGESVHKQILKLLKGI